MSDNHGERYILPPLDAQHLDAYMRPAAAYLARLSVGSRRTVKRSLDTIAEHLLPGSHAMVFPWEQVRYHHVIAVRTWLNTTYATPTANKILTSLRCVLHEARRLGLMSAENCLAACDVPSIKGERLPAGRALAPEEIETLIKVCVNDTSPAGSRDATLFAVLYGTGLRRSEVVHLDVPDYDHDAMVLTIRSGKGNKDRQVPVVNGTRAALHDWLRRHNRKEGPLFVRIDGHGRLTEQRLTDQAVRYILRQRAQEAQLPTCTPHDFRRTLIGDLLEAGADISTVQRIVGHTDVSTTARYDRRGEAAKRRAAELIRVPYPARGESDY